MELVDTMIAAVQHDVTVLKFNGLAFVEPVIRLGTDLPGLAMIVTIQDMTVVSLCPTLREAGVIAGNDQATFVLATLQLNAGTGAGCIPTPALLFRGWCDLFCLGPSLAIVV